MPWTRFYEEPDLALSLLTYVAASPHQRYLHGLKEAATSYLKDNTSHLISYRGTQQVNLNAGGATMAVQATSDFGRHVNYGYVAMNELFVAPFGRISVFIPAGSAALLDTDAMLPGFYVPPTTSRIMGRGARKSEVMGYLVENHIFGTLFEPAKSREERIILGAIAFVKLAAAVAATVTTFGASAATLAAAIPDAVSQVRQLVETIRSEVPGVASAIQETVEAGRAFHGAVSRGGHSGGSTFGGLGTTSSGGTTMGTARAEASGVDVFGAPLSRTKTGAAAIQEQVRMLDSLRMICVQQITPMRTILTDIKNYEYSAEPHMVAVEGRQVEVSARIPTRADYSVTALAFESSLIRVGECPREAFSAFMFTNTHALTDAAQRAVLRPWSARVAPTSLKKGDIQYFGQLQRTGPVSNLFGPYGDGSMSYNDRVFSVAWDDDARWSTYQKANTRGPLPDELVAQSRPEAIDSARQEHVRRIEAQRAALAAEQQRLATVRAGMAATARAEALKVRVMDAAAFHSRTKVFFGSSHITLTHVENGLRDYHGLARDDFGKRLSLIGDLGLRTQAWRDHINRKTNKNQSKLDVAQELALTISTERAALEGVLRG
jgi:hypothetical protein